MAAASQDFAPEVRAKAAAFAYAVGWVRQKWPHLDRFFIADGPPVIPGKRRPFPLAAIAAVKGVSLELYEDFNWGYFYENDLGRLPHAVLGVWSLKPTRGGAFTATVWLMVWPRERPTVSTGGDLTLENRGSGSGAFQATPVGALGAIPLVRMLLSEVATPVCRADFLEYPQNWLWQAERRLLWAVTAGERGGSGGDPLPLLLHSCRVDRAGAPVDVRTRRFATEGFVLPGSVQLSPGARYLTWASHVGGDRWGGGGGTVRRYFARTDAPAGAGALTVRDIPSGQNPFAGVWVGDAEWAEMTAEPRTRDGFTYSWFDAASGEQRAQRAFAMPLTAG